MLKLRWILILPLAIVLIQAAFYYPRLPEKVASHFDMEGNPNGWSSRGSLLGVYLGAFALLTLLFLGTSSFLRKLPDFLVNLPRKDYWLSPERREATHDFIARQLVWMGLGTQVFFAVLFQLTFQANLSGENRLASVPFWILTVGFLAFIAAWTVRFLLRFLASE